MLLQYFILFYGWVVFCYICTTSSLSIHLSMDIYVVFMFGYREQCCYEHRGTRSFLNYTFSRYVLRSRVARSYGNSIFSFLRNFHTSCMGDKLLQSCPNSLGPHGLFIACQFPRFMEFSRPECWSGSPWPPPGDLPDPGIQSTSLMSSALQEDSLPLVPPGNPHVAIPTCIPTNSVGGFPFLHTLSSICYL